MKHDSITIIGIVLLCLTLWLCVREICKCALACEAVKAGQIKFKAK